ncbi:hypothetical protein [Nonomuraea basaltis]|uniref:hypothetical protein n=1 Tax=Nonomuraea basaltis TaxID=2495887 RepID=UPI00110C3FB2|nr:hypothetical protein [Nonomuraea basaltis]TMR91298.1 hypothetical protein EJK15_50805 [Nonomuraea basaltis]
MKRAFQTAAGTLSATASFALLVIAILTGDHAWRVPLTIAVVVLTGIAAGFIVALIRSLPNRSPQDVYRAGWHTSESGDG